jgi:hypothetical protein
METGRKKTGRLAPPGQTFQRRDERLEGAQKL